MSEFIQHCQWLSNNRILVSRYQGDIRLLTFSHQDYSDLQPEKIITARSGFLTTAEVNFHAEKSRYLITAGDESELILWKLANQLEKTAACFFPAEFGAPQCAAESQLFPGTIYVGHARNIISRWLITDHHLKLINSQSLDSRTLSPAVQRSYQEPRSIFLNPAGKIVCTGESGIISFLDETTFYFLHQQDYLPAANYGMNDLLFDQQTQIYWGTCCTQFKTDPQLHTWQALNNSGEFTLKPVTSWCIPALDQGFSYAHRVRLFTFNKQLWLGVSLGDGTLRLGIIDTEHDTPQITWQKTIILEKAGAAEFDFSPDQSQLVAGVKQIYIFDLQKLLDSPAKVIQNPQPSLNFELLD